MTDARLGRFWPVPCTANVTILIPPCNNSSITSSASSLSSSTGFEGADLLSAEHASGTQNKPTLSFRQNDWLEVSWSSWILPIVWLTNLVSTRTIAGWLACLTIETLSAISVHNPRNQQLGLWQARRHWMETSAPTKCYSTRLLLAGVTATLIKQDRLLGRFVRLSSAQPPHGIRWDIDQFRMELV